MGLYVGKYAKGSRGGRHVWVTNIRNGTMISFFCWDDQIDSFFPLTNIDHENTMMFLLMGQQNLGINVALNQMQDI